MGEVYMAEHQLLKRPCALKLIKPDVNSNPIAVARFEREVRSAAMLSHPNTIEIFDYGHTDDGTFYYVMEYLPGLSLSDLVRQFGPMEPGPRRLPDAAGLRGPRRGAPVRPGPPRPEAREHPGGDPGGQVRHRQGARLRPGQADRGPGRPPVDGRLHRQRHAPVHVARAGDRERRTSTAGPTSTRWARSSTSCSPGVLPSRANPDRADDRPPGRLIPGVGDRRSVGVLPSKGGRPVSMK